MAKPTYSELLLKEDLRLQEANRRRLAIELNICPDCGSPIIRQNIEIFDKPKVYFFGLIKKTSKYWDYRIVCSKDKKHYENKMTFYSELP